MQLKSCIKFILFPPFSIPKRISMLRADQTVVAPVVPGGVYCLQYVPFDGIFQF